MLAEIITIGDEILIGQIVDTNSAWMAQKLNEAGIRIKQITSVSDDREHILQALNLATERADLVIITGGLGPTKDDITKKTLAEFFKTTMRLDEEALENVKNIFSKYKAPLLEVNVQQANVLENSVTLQNKNGTAPGMWIEHNNKIYVSLPGVPFEMMYLMEEEVIPRIISTYSLPIIYHHTILTAGIGESMIAEEISDIEDGLPSHIKLAYLPKLGVVRLRLSGYASDKEILMSEISAISKKIVERIADYVIIEADVALEKSILDYMQLRNLTLTVAESCTGGALSQTITQHPGSSSVFLGGAITYSNTLKVSMLGVSNQTILQFGAVSVQTVEEMAKGALTAYHSDYSLAISGIAGPDGGVENKPVGTVWIAVANANKVISRKFQFGNRRKQNIERSVTNALIMLFKLLKQDNP
ncbi:MAG: competence/damage-inducible protein A [Flavobacterium sp.]|nr:competence/damage-inducible protein A [Pedobacter sp.]